MILQLMIRFHRRRHDDSSNVKACVPTGNCMTNYLNRREMLCRGGGGFGALALAYLLGQEQAARGESGAPHGIHLQPGDRRTAGGGLRHRRAQRSVKHSGSRVSARATPLARHHIPVLIHQGRSFFPVDMYLPYVTCIRK